MNTRRFDRERARCNGVEIRSKVHRALDPHQALGSGVYAQVQKNTPVQTLEASAAHNNPDITALRIDPQQRHGSKLRSNTAVHFASAVKATV